MFSVVCTRGRTRCRVTLAIVLSIFVPAIASAQTSIKLAYWNIQSGKGEPALPGHPVTFSDNGNCTDPSRPMNAWGVGFVQEHLRQAIAGDPAIIALGLGEAWPCGSPENIRQVLGWKSRSSERNGVGIVARHGFAGPEEWVQLDTSLNTNPRDTMWVLRVRVCLDSGCTGSLNVFTAHWYASPEPNPNVGTTYERQAQQTLEFLRRAGGADPHVLIGDLNVWEGSYVCEQSPSNYGLNTLRDAGYLDAWPLVHGSAEGMTAIVNRAGCGVPEGYTWKRIDYAWSPANYAAVDIKRFGMTTPGSEAPSDHYGIIAEFATPGGWTAPEPGPGPEPEPPPSDGGEIVLHARNASIVAGGWRVVGDSTAAGGARLSHADEGAAKLSAAQPAPTHYFELTFNAEAGRGYRLWMRGRAAGDHWGNDSVFVQFSGSVDESDAPVYRIGTTPATDVNLEDGPNQGLAGWGWQDNGYGVGVLGPLVYFAASGPQTIRVQTREDGFSIDQIVLSAQRYLTSAPGALKNDTTILPASGTPTTTDPEAPADDTQPPSVSITAPSESAIVTGTVTVTASATDNTGVVLTVLLVDGTAVAQDTSAPYSFGWSTTSTANGTHRLVVRASDAAGNRADSTPVQVTVSNPTARASDIVLYAADATVVGRAWTRQSDGGAAGGALLRHPNADAAKRTTALANPTDYFELTFQAEANVPYHLWMRAKADSNYWSNDSVYVQFTGGTAYAIGTTSAASVNLEDCSGCGLAGWGWQDNGWGVNVFGPDITFTSSGTQTIRVQTREDGLSIDQIILSPSQFRTAPPGLLKNDATIYPRSFGGAPPADTAPPVTSITAPATGATVSGTTTVTVSATDNVGVTRVELWIDGALASTRTSAPYQFSWNTTAVSNGTHTLQSRAYDAAGQTGVSESVTVLVANGTSTGPQEIVLYAADAPVVVGRWRREADSTAAGGSLLHHPDLSEPKLTSALANPNDYFELTFTAEANVQYHLWARLKSERNSWGNESVWVQFSSGTPYTIGTTSGADINLENCSGCGVSGWGWQDNGWGAQLDGPNITFSTGGLKTIRVQTREDGTYIDQIILSPSRHLTTAPGLLKNDATLYPRS